jgi:hypothetical protein
MLLYELKERLMDYYSGNPDAFIELLEITIEDLLDRFEDVIEEKQELIEQELQENYDNE